VAFEFCVLGVMSISWPVPRALIVKRPTQMDQYRQLENSLLEMGLRHLLQIPWNILHESYVKDFGTDAPALDVFLKYRGRPEEWTTAFIGRAFKCPDSGQISRSQRAKEADMYFDGTNSSHGWNVKQCNVPELKRLFEFLVPIIHPKKPTFLPVSMANTVVASWLGVAQINWAHILQQAILGLVDGLESGKATVLPSYLAQLYKAGGCLMPTKKKERK
jgi:hypothetical protein